ncbi:MAG TPA: response regulator [Nitrososphaera sp.]|nr:response regulator [Nitrososphaera sp.]
MIILVDDEPDIVNVFGKVLQRDGYQVHEFTDPLKALNFLSTNYEKCSLVITDLRMPYMNGIEFASQVRRISPDVKLLLITAYETESYKNQITHLGFNGILHKPLLPRILKMTVEKILGPPTQ